MRPRSGRFRPEAACEGELILSRVSEDSDDHGVTHEHEEEQQNEDAPGPHRESVALEPPPEERRLPTLLDRFDHILSPVR
jgi:hypothetical protein